MFDAMPDGWLQGPLGSVADVILGQSPPSAVVNSTGDGLPFIQGNAEFGARNPSPLYFARDAPKKADKGDVLLSVRAPVGEVNVAEGPLYIGRGVAALRARTCDPDFLFYAIGGLQTAFARLSQGSTFDAINGKELRQIAIPLPPLDEQRRIAEVLRAVDDVIAANAQAVSQAVCLLRDSRFALTGLDGSRPDWRRGPLLDFFQLQRGHDLPVQDRKEGPIPVIASNGPVGTHNEAAIPAPAVVTGRSGTIGKVTYFDGPCWPLNTTLFVRDYKGSNPRYVFHFLSAFPLIDYQSGTGVPTLNRNDVHVVEVPWPTLEVQASIAASLDALEQSVATMTAGLDQLRTLKVQLSGDLLSGRVRVPA